ncbi:MAG: hypothetical protein B7Z20_09240 [Sphingobium sp. 32-64-5]|nr:MAG: hypothetical protein B7Z20_09240 [Sphingobium sp. 32-64-5]
MVEKDGQPGALANYYSFAYAPIFEGTPAPARQQALIRTIAASLRQRYERVSFYPLIDDDGTRGTAHMMRDAFAAAGWIALLTDQNSNYFLDIKGRDFATYWAQRPSRLRSGVRRKGKSGPYDFAIHDKLTEDRWQDYLAVYAASWKNAEPFPDMVRAIAEDAAARGVLRLGFARDGGQAVAAQLWTIEGRTACVHKMAHSTAHDRHSPGTLLSHHMFAHMIDHEPIDRIDYGTGNNAYKRDWMEGARPMLRLDCFNPRKARMWLPALRTRISQLVRRPG